MTSEKVPVEREEALMREFYLSPSYNPKADRPADNVKAAIAFTLSTLRPAAVGGSEPAAYLHHHPKFGTDCNPHPITDADKQMGWTQTPLYRQPVAAAVGGDARERLARELGFMPRPHEHTISIHVALRAIQSALDERAGLQVDRELFLAAIRQIAQYVADFDDNRRDEHLIEDHVARFRELLYRGRALTPSPATPEPSWGYAKTVGNLIAQLRTMDPEGPIYGAYHVVEPGVRAVCRVKGLTISRERVIDGKTIDSSRTDVPYSYVAWSSSREPEILTDSATPEPIATGEYACAPIEGVDPVFVPHMLRGAMALRYMRQVKCSDDEAAMHAAATWDTDWTSDPAPRTFDLAEQQVDDDLECWEGD